MLLLLNCRKKLNSNTSVFCNLTFNTLFFVFLERKKEKEKRKTMDDIEIKIEIKEEPIDQSEHINNDPEDIKTEENSEHSTNTQKCDTENDLNDFVDEIKLEFEEEEEETNKSNAELEQTNNFRKYFGTGDEKLPFQCIK